MLILPLSIQKNFEANGVVALIAELSQGAEPIAPSLLENTLSPIECNRLKGFKDEVAAWRFAVGRVLLKEFISQCFDMPTKSIFIRLEKSGKPRIEHPPGIGISVSHSGPYVAIVVTRIGECGIDIEAVGEVPDHLPIHPQFFSVQQDNWISKGKGDMGPGRRFLRLWTRKEAYLKATGEGLSGLSSKIGFETAERGPVRVIDERLSEGMPGKFFVYDLANNSDYCLSVCLDRKPSHIESCSLTFGRI